MLQGVPSDALCGLGDALLDIGVLPALGFPFPEESLDASGRFEPAPSLPESTYERELARLDAAARSSFIRPPRANRAGMAFTLVVLVSFGPSPSPPADAAADAAPDVELKVKGVDELGVDDAMAMRRGESVAGYGADNL